MKKLLATGLWMTFLALAIHGVSVLSPVVPQDVVLGGMTRNNLAAMKCCHALESAKLAAQAAEGRTCEEYATATDAKTGSETSFKVGSAGQRITVSSLVSQALTDQMRLLEARQKELERWSRADQAQFAKWFGTYSPDAREMIYERIRVLMLLNKEYSVGNFRRAVPSRPGLFAFVHPTDPSKIFVDQAFVSAPVLGENSRPGTFTHEMSHFVLAGGTKDIAYGVAKCRVLARQKPVLALTNADNFEYYVENVR